MRGLFSIPDMKLRLETPELMDLPECDQNALHRTLSQFRMTNALFTASRRLITRHILSEITARALKRATLVDIGAGGCDLSIWLVKQARKKGVTLQVTALDYDKRVVAFAKDAVRGYPEISVIHGDCSNLRSLGRFDFAFSNHVLHHLKDPAIESLLTSLLDCVDISFVMNDLRRSKSAYAAFALFSALFLRGSLAYNDGLLSIRKGFVRPDLETLIALRFSGSGIKIERAFPARLALVWHRAGSV